MTKTILKNRAGQVYAPATRSDAVFRPDGSAVEDVLCLHDEYLFDDIDPRYKSFYATDDGIIWYVNSESLLCSFDEQTRATKVYEGIREQWHVSVGKPNPACKRHIVRDGKVLLFWPDAAMPIRQYDLATQEMTYAVSPEGFDGYFRFYGFFVEYGNKIFVSEVGKNLICSIDFATGELKTYEIDFRNGLQTSYFSYKGDGYSLFVTTDGKIVKYDDALDEFSVVVDMTVVSDDVIKTNGSASCIFKVPNIDNGQYAFLFNQKGFCVMPVEDILAGKYDSSKYFVQAPGYRNDAFNGAYPFAHLGANMYVNPYQTVCITNNYGKGYLHCFAMTVDASPERMGYFINGKYGHVMFRNDTVYDANQHYPIYRKYGNNVH